MPTKQEMSEFEKRVATMKELAESKTEECRGNETTTKNKLIQPFFREVLGYNLEDSEGKVNVKYEHSLHHRGGSGGKVDYAIFIGEEAMLLIEAKAYGRSMSDDAVEQLRDYLEASKAPVGILTDGVSYRFFGKHNRKVDEEPFFRFDLLHYTDDEVDDLILFRKKNFLKKVIKSSVPDLRTKTLEKKHTREVQKHIRTIISEPSRDLAKFLAKEAKVYYSYPGADKVMRAQRLVAEAFRVIIEEKVEERLAARPPGKIPETRPPRGRRGIQFDLLAMGIPIRAQLDFHAGGHRAFVTGANTVEYQGKDMKLIDATIPLVGRTAIRPIAYWLYKGCPLVHMYDDWVGSG